MNINRKVQLAAAAVIVNGALAVSVLSPNPSLAGTCNTKSGCSGIFVCQNPSIRASYCAGIADPGCTYVSSWCSYPADGGCNSSQGFYLVTCNYH